MMALEALNQSVSDGAGLLIENNLFHIKVTMIDIRCGQEPIFSL
jgi:hypothetical protein